MKIPPYGTPQPPFVYVVRGGFKQLPNVYYMFAIKYYCKFYLNEICEHGCLFVYLLACLLACLID